MILEYEPASELLHISVNKLLLNCHLPRTHCQMPVGNIEIKWISRICWPPENIKAMPHIDSAGPHLSTRVSIFQEAARFETALASRIRFSNWSRDDATVRCRIPSRNLSNLIRCLEQGRCHSSGIHSHRCPTTRHNFPNNNRCPPSGEGMMSGW